MALIIGLSFYLGWLQGIREQAPSVVLSCSPDTLTSLTMPRTALAVRNSGEEQLRTGAFVGSKNGTKYYRPSCSSVQRIKPANYRWFIDAQDAEIQGYTPGNC